MLGNVEASKIHAGEDAERARDADADVADGEVPQEQPQQHRSQPREEEEMGREEREKGRKGEGERDQEVRKEEERKAEKESEEEVKKDVMDWTVVSRSKKQKKMIQIYVKVNGGKVIPTEVNLTDDKVEDVMRQVPSSDDMYVTLHGRVLKRSDKLKSCEVTDGCTSKNKAAGERKKKSPKKVEQNDQSTEEKNLPKVDTIAEMLERGSRTGVGGWSAEMIQGMMEMEDEQMEKMLRMFRSNFTEELGGDPDMMIGGMKKFVQNESGEERFSERKRQERRRRSKRRR